MTALKQLSAVANCDAREENDIADDVAMRKDKFSKRFLLNSSVVCEICSLVVK